ncbi:MAG: hypothetical protein IJO74_04130 [Clostridia bacterium]|nr:hypothetical protein [Clostridia bacterium]
MKNKSQHIIRKTLPFLLIFSVIFSAIFLFSCEKEQPVVIKDSDTCIVIIPDSSYLEGKTKVPLIDYMEYLKGKGELDYTAENGMITSLNGTENPSDFSSCWMLYTNDPDNSSTAWGTIEYNGTVCGSALTGADTAIIKPDALYIWVFKAFS